MVFKKHFPGQLPEETTFRVLHRHWFNIASHFIVLACLCLGVVIFSLVAPILLALANITLIPGLIPFLVTTSLLFLWVYAFLIWIDYYFDVWIITNERVLNIEQKGLFMRSVSEVSLERVQDVTTKTEGFLPTILGYGDLFIQTAGEERQFHFRNIANPDKHKDEIVQLAKKLHERRQTSSLQENPVL